MLIIKTVTITSDKLYADKVPSFAQNAFAMTLTPAPKVSSVNYVVKPAVTYNDKGIRVATHQHNFYYRLLVEPNNLALGLLTTATSQTINVWNGYDTNASIIRVESINLSGFNLQPADGTPLPYVIPVHKTVKLALTSTGDVAPTTDGEFRIHFSNGDVLVVRVSATSLVLLNYRPNWVEGYKEGYHWLTDITTSWNGTEQRRRLRGRPRYDAEYDIDIWGADARTLANALVNWQNRVFAAPNWLQMTPITAEAIVGATVLQVDTKDRGFVSGEYLYIESLDGGFETVGVDTITPTAITIKTQLSRGFSIGDRVYPVITGNVNDSIDIENLTDAVRNVTLRLNGDVQSHNPPLYATNYPVGLQYKGKEVFPFKHNWSDSIKLQIVANQDKIDFDVGYKRLIQKGLSLSNMGVKTVLRNREQLARMKAFLSRRCGRQKSFFASSRLQDFRIVEEYTTNAKYLYLRNDGLTMHMRNLQPYVEIVTPSATHHRQILMFEDTGNNVCRATLDETINANFLPDDVTRMSQLYLVRLGSDDITFEYQSDTVATVAMTIQQVQS